MRKYRVTLDRQRRETTTIEVEANDEGEAGDLALDLAQNADDWYVSDVPEEPFVGDIEEVA